MGLIGSCLGSTVALAEVARRPLGAAVSCYGGGLTDGSFGYPPLVELAPRLRSPWLGLCDDRPAGFDLSAAADAWRCALHWCATLLRPV